MPAPATSTSELLDLIRKSGIVSQERFAALVPDPDSLPAAAQDGAAVLIERGLITKFQSTLLLQGRYKGFRLGSYVIREQLGRGGMGAVYLAEHDELRRNVAIKVLVTHKDADQKLAQDRFLREARAAAALDHPNIVRIHDVARHAETPYLVMEYVDGSNLQHILDRDGPMSATDAVECIAQAAAGLQHAHEKGFVHRDIKPANLMKDTSGVIKILDMGLARSFDKTEDKLTEVMDKGAIVGTADFISPEQALNNAIDIRADIYSLGATFFALVSGKPPFEGNTTQKLMQHQLKTPPSLTALNKKLPTGLAEVIIRMLAKKASDRYQTPAEVITALAPWLPGSHRVLAGLSRTRLAETADIAVAIQEVARGGSSLRLNSVALQELAREGSSLRLQTVSLANEDAEIGETSQSATDTADGITATRTSRTPQSSIHRGPQSNIHRGSQSAIPRTPPSEEKRKLALTKRSRRKPLIIGGAIFVSILGVAIAVLVNGNASESPVSPAIPATPVAAVTPAEEHAIRKSPPTVALKPPTVATDPQSPTKTLPEAPSQFTLFDATAIKPFTIKTRGREVVEGEKASLPPNVMLGAPLSTSECEFSLQPADDGNALRMTALAGTAAAGLVLDPEPEGSASLKRGATYRVHVEYRTDGSGKMYLSAQTRTAKPLHVPLILSATKGEWKEADLEFRRGSDPVRILVDSKAQGVNNSLFVRRVEFTRVTETATPASNVVLAIDQLGMKSFSHLYEVAPDDVKKASKVASKTGDGKPPVNWSSKAVSQGCQTEYCYEESKRAFGLRNIGGPGGALMTGPPLTIPSGACRMQCEYQSGGTPGLVRFRFRTIDGGVRDIAVPTPTPPGEWVKLDTPFDLKGATAGNFEIVNNDPRPEGGLFFRDFQVVEIPYSDLPPVIEGTPAFQLDIAVIPEFRNRKVGGSRLEGVAEKLPKGMKALSVKTTGAGEFARLTREGVPALAVGVSNGELGAQYTFDLEGELGVALKPRQAYRLKVQYQTSEDGHGAMTLQTLSKSGTTSRLVPLDTTVLPTHTSGWRTAFIDFTREDDILIRFAIDAKSLTTGSLVYLRSVEVVEVK